jgi:ABC-type multidrug transport system fused ATPase/permease subunit
MLLMLQTPAWPSPESTPVAAGTGAAVDDHAGADGPTRRDRPTDTLRAYGAILRRLDCTVAPTIALSAAAGLIEVAALACIAPVLRLVSGADASSVPMLGAMSPTAGLAAFAGLGVLSSLVHYGSRLSVARLYARVELQLRSKLLAALSGAEWSVCNRLRHGRVGRGLTMDSHQAAHGIELLVVAAGALAVVLVMLAAAVIASPFVATFAAGFFVIVFTGLRALGRKREQHARGLRAKTDEIAALGGALVSFLRYCRASNTIAVLGDDFAAVCGDAARAFRSMRRHADAKTLYTESCAAAFLAVVLAWRIHSTGSVPPGHIIALAILYRMTMRVTRVQDWYAQSMECGVWAQAWMELYQGLVARGAPRAGGQAPTFGAGLRFEDVSFDYGQREGGGTLQRVSFELAPGKSLAIVGASGSGKSTILDLATGLIPPGSGRVRVDGVDLGAIDLAAWRDRIGFVPQDCPVFHGTVLSNVTLGRGAPDRAKAERCARLAGAWEFVRRLPQGLDAPIHEGGRDLSAGQRQRLAIARALYGDPWLLVLDEPTSAIDEPGIEVVRSMLEVVSGTTAVLLVTHHPRLAQATDAVLELDAGVVKYGGLGSAP